MERLQKVIASSGVTSRRKAEELITSGRVKVDGKVVRELGTKVGQNQHIEVDNVLIKNEDKVYILLNKPRGVVTTTDDDKKRKTVIDLIETNKRIYPVGRLDYDTTGVLLLTNDGEFANILTHPKNNVEKIYIAKVKGIATAKEIIPLQEGITYEGVKYGKSKVKLRKVDKKNRTSMLEIRIHEGKNHQIKNMLAAVRLDVLKLKRERVGFFDLKGLPSGEYRYLTPKEVAKVYAINKKEKN